MVYPYKDKMNIEISGICRHPIKSIGAEEITSTILKRNATMPFDRVWALTHEKTKFNFSNPDWVPCSSFIRVSIAPKLMAITARVDESNSSIELFHPELPSLKIKIESPQFSGKIVDWVSSLCPENGPQSFKICKVPNRGMTDTDYPSISLLSFSSLDLLSRKAGLNLDMHRFRGNLWMKNSIPFEEFNWIGSNIKIGEVELEVIEPIERCNATKTNPQNGIRDVDTLQILRDNFQHQNFGVYCKVLSDGEIKLGDRVKVNSG